MDSWEGPSLANDDRLAGHRGPLAPTELPLLLALAAATPLDGSRQGNWRRYFRQVDARPRCIARIRIALAVTPHIACHRKVRADLRTRLANTGTFTAADRFRTVLAGPTVRIRDAGLGSVTLDKDRRRRALPPGPTARRLVAGG